MDDSIGKLDYAPKSFVQDSDGNVLILDKNGFVTQCHYSDIGDSGRYVFDSPIGGSLTAMHRLPNGSTIAFSIKDGMCLLAKGPYGNYVTKEITSDDNIIKNSSEIRDVTEMVDLPNGEIILLGKESSPRLLRVDADYELEILKKNLRRIADKAAASN